MRFLNIFSPKAVAMALAMVSAAFCADLNDVLSKARAFVGSEEALDGLHSVHFVGIMETTEATPEGSRPIRARIEIHFQKPFRQRIELTLGERKEVTALDEYEGWQRVQSAGEPDRWRLSLLGKDQIRRLRANTWENLSFYRGLEEVSGRIEDHGTVEMDGRKVRKVAFVHSPEIVFTRFFDEESGRLVLTETEKQGLIREDGELRAGDIRFPSKIITINRLPDGSSREVTVVFERIIVNEPLARELFAVPPVRSR